MYLTFSIFENDGEKKSGNENSRAEIPGVSEKLLSNASVISVIIF